jgi:thiosulfate dehydrogenase
MKPASNLPRAVVPLLLAVLGCSGADDITPVERGRELFTTHELSPSNLNNYSCSICHRSRPVDDHLIRTGATLAGATRRESFWGGQENDLLRSINACRSYFMVAPEPLTPEQPDAQALYAYLKSLEPGDAEPVPFTIVRDIEPIDRGDATRGLALYPGACGYCHGAMHSGLGRLNERVPVLPEDSVAEHFDYTPRALRLVFIEKVRHGLFLGYGGDMPPFSTELLPNEDLADILEALEITGE